MLKRTWLVALVVTGCGGGGGGSSPSRWKDDLGNDNFTPEPGETRVATLAFAGDAAAIADLWYAPDPDLVLAIERTPTGNRIHAGRISAGKLDPYCGELTSAGPAELELHTALFAFVGDDLVIYMGDERMIGTVRTVCSRGDGTTSGAVKSRALPAAFTARDPGPDSLPVADGFWYLTRSVIPGADASLVHLTYASDAAAATMPAPPSQSVAVERRTGAFFFKSGADVSRFDVATATTTTVATGLGAGALTTVTDKGLLVSSGTTAEFVVFAKGPTPHPGSLAANGMYPTPGQDPFFVETSGAGVQLGGRRYDATTGAELPVTFVNAPGDVVPQNPRALTRSGHHYMLGDDFHPLKVWVAPTSAPVAIDVASATFSFNAYPGVDETSDRHANLVNDDDGNCVFHTGGGPGGQVVGGTNQKPGTVAPIGVAGNRTLSVGRCGATSATPVMVGAAGAAPPSNYAGPIYFNALEAKFRDAFCVDCVGGNGGRDTADYEALESGWTILPDGTIKPVVKQASWIWLRARSLKNLVARYGKSLAVVTGE